MLAAWAITSCSPVAPISSRWACRSRRSRIASSTQPSSATTATAPAAIAMIPCVSVTEAAIATT